MEDFDYSSAVRELSYNPTTGLLTYSSSNRWHKEHDIAGHVKSNGYIALWLKDKNGVRRKLHAHRVIWFMVYGEIPNLDIDHIDGNRTNNALTNLRSVDRTTNLQNIKKAKSHNKSTGLLGAYKVSGKDKYTSSISVNKQHVYLGSYDTAELAHEAYLSAKRNLHIGSTL